MKYLTILNHGTANSSSTTDLVISKLADLLDGREEHDWILNEGAGTDELYARDDVGKGKENIASAAYGALKGLARGEGLARSVSRHSNLGVAPETTATLGGIVAGKGVEKNVARAVKFVNRQLEAFGARSGGITVNLAGHSRGSITCYKIARALRNDAATKMIPVNVFAIDPVPGNMGALNDANYKNIALGGNIVNSFLMLAESEHRLAFRPYVDALYSMGLANHKVDTIPGTHGGINELAGSEKESAHIVMSRAVEFLHANQTRFKNGFDIWTPGNSWKLETYANLMRKIKKYQRDASLFNPLNLVTGGGQVETQRTAVVHGPKEAWGVGMEQVAGVVDSDAAQRTRKDHHGLKLNEALKRGNMLPTDVHSERANRFFANLEHQTLFSQAYPRLRNNFLQLERGVDKARLKEIQAELPGNWSSDSTNMSMPEREYCAHWLKKRGCAVRIG